MISASERQQKFYALMEAMNQLAQKAKGFPGLAERMELLSRGFCLAEPTLDSRGPGFNIFHRSIPGISHTSIKILPRVSGDEEILRLIDPHLEHCLGSHFHSFNMIILNMEADSAVAMAFIGFHELGHALKSTTTGRVMTDQILTWNEEATEELEMRTFDSNLMLVLGGDEYKKRMEYSVQVITDAKRRKGIGAEGFHWHESMELEADQVFDAVYGPAPNTQDEKIRGDSFQVYCQLAAADRVFRRQQAKDFKVLFMKRYRESAKNLI